LNPTEASAKKGHIVPLKIESAAYGGKGIGFVNGKACFVPNTAPGDEILARIVKKSKSHLEGKLIEITTPSPVRIRPLCSHANVCGGCSWQHTPYDLQVDFKRQHVEDHMRRIGNIQDVEILPTLRSDRPFYYRNKMEYSFGDRRWLTDDEISSGDALVKNTLALGLHVPGRFDRILDLNECHLQDIRSYQILNSLRALALEHEMDPYNPVKKEGWLRHLVVRNSLSTDEWMVNIMTFYKNESAMQRIVDHLLTHFPFISTVIESLNETWSPTAYDAEEIIHYGSGYITDSIGRFSFRIHPTTFFQTNTAQAERLFETAIQYADISGGTVYDLYCGVGTLSLFASDKAERVVGVELNPQSIINAEINAQDNHVLNASFRTGDARDTFSDALISEFGVPDVLLTDPPRAGMHDDVVQRINQLNVPTVVYVSCNSATMARDLALMSESYDITHIQPVDMFPQTYHIETVARLVSKNPSR
jgi:23S rRNA (uracil1939-C5)-methyltransferase